MSGVPVAKVQAYGNDFLFLDASYAAGTHADAASPSDAARTLTVRGSAIARAICHRHHGIGADGLIFYTLRDRGATMTLFNADGSASELSGNGLRCLAALVAGAQHVQQGTTVAVETAAGPKTLELLERHGERYTFRAALGVPEDVREVKIPVLNETLTASVLRIGNPQCVVLGPLPDEARFQRFGPALSTHAMFPAGTNVEFAHVEAPDKVRIKIWERGVGPTTSSGTGASASAVAAAAHGGAARDVTVMSAGGTQRVEWREEGVYLTGWAEVVLKGEWFPGDQLARSG